MKAIIFDFDGVILDSVNVKTLAFVELYSTYGEKIQQQVKSYHLLNGGISRFEKFKYYHKNFLNIDITDSELKSLADQFSSLVFEKVCNSKYIKGSLSFLKTVSKTHLTFICTGTPQTEIESILKFKSLDAFFNDVYGSPISKVTIINQIIDKYKLSSDEIIFIGDAMTDYKAAHETNVKFIGVENSETNFPTNTILVDDLMDINKLNY